MRRKKNLLVVAIFLLLCCIISGQTAEESRFAVKLTPHFSLPLGEKNTALFQYGWGGALDTKFRLPVAPLIYFDAGADYLYLPLVSTDETLPYFNSDSVSIIAGGVGGGVHWQPSAYFSLEAGGRGGYYYVFENYAGGDRGGNGFLKGGVKFSIYPLPFFSLDLGASYRQFFGFYSDIDVIAGFSYNVVPKRAGSGPEPYKDLQLELLHFEPVFPVFYKYYDDHAIGRTTIRNNGKSTLHDLNVNFFVKQYMDNPKKCVAPSSLAPGESAEIEIYGLFNQSVMENTEGTKVSVSLEISSSVKEKPYRNEIIQTLRMYDRNAITWDDDRKAAAFVTAKDFTVLKFAKNTSRVLDNKVAGNNGILNKNFLLALSLHEALTLYGIKYAIDPASSYIELSKDSAAIDFLQFPNQTLEYGAGDCDDLSILYSALLESLGVETAFITVPGHIYMAFSLGIDQRTAEKTFLRTTDLIFIDDKAWMPVEVTLIGEGFLRAWQQGAREWRDYALQGQAQLFPMHTSWEIYEPVGFAASESTLRLPPEDKLSAVCIAEIQKYINQELYPQVAELEGKLKTTNNDPAVRNQMGILYARYGQNEEAAREFNAVLAVKAYVPALVNLGNIYYLEGDYRTALDYYKRADKLQPNRPGIILALARSYFELEELGPSQDLYRQLTALSPSLADKYSYLSLTSDDKNRASNIEIRKGGAEWEE